MWDILGGFRKMRCDGCGRVMKNIQYDEIYSVCYNDNCVHNNIEKFNAIATNRMWDEIDNARIKEDKQWLSELRL